MIEESLRSRLLAISEISDEIDSRFYPLILPQNVIYPAVSYQKLTQPVQHSQSGRSGLMSPSFEINVWCDVHSGGYAKCKEIADYIRQALDGLHGETILGVKWQATIMVSERDFYDEVPEVYRVQQDYTIWHDTDQAILTP